MVRSGWRVRDFGDELLIERPDGCADRDAVASSARLMDQLLRVGPGDGHVRRVLVDVHRDLFGPPAPSFEIVRSHLAAAVRAGRVVVQRRLRRAVSMPVEVEEEAQPLGPAPEDPTDWLEIKVVDGDGKPVPGIRYSVTTADGSTLEGAVDKQGFARLEGLKPGTCKVSFPDVHEDEIKAA